MKTPATLHLPLAVQPDQPSHGATLVIVDCESMPVAWSPESKEYQAPGQEEDLAALRYLATTANFYPRMRLMLEYARDTLRGPPDDNATPAEIIAGIDRIFAELAALDVPIPSGRRVECADCEWEGRESQTAPIKDIFQRVEPGEPMPAGECPDCGALAILSDRKRGRGLKI